MRLVRIVIPVNDSNHGHSAQKCGNHVIKIGKIKWLEALYAAGPPIGL